MAFFPKPSTSVLNLADILPSQQISPSSKKGMIGLWATAIFLSLLFGLLLALQMYILVVPLLALLIGPVLIVYPRFGLWVAIIGALVASGLIDLYLPSFRPLKWGLAILSIGLAVIAMGMFVVGRSTQKLTRLGKPTMMFWALGFFICAAFSSLVNWQGVSGFAVGIKGYFQLWGLLIAIYFLVRDEQDASLLIRFLLLLALIQLPFVLHQFFVLVPKRSGLMAAQHGVVAVDVVAGTFGGSMNGGGRSSSLALLAAIGLSLLLTRFKVGFVGIRRVLLLGTLLLTPILLNEAKVIVVLLPVVFFLIFRDRILKNPLKALAGLFALGILLVVFVFAYMLLPGEKNDVNDMFKETVEYNLGQRGYGNLLLNRSSVYPFWLKEHMRGDIVHAFIGHGPGSTNEGSMVLEDSLATKRYPRVGIGLTGLSALLWEVGLLGTVIAIALLYSAYRLGGRLSKRWEGTVHWPILKTAQIAMPLFAINLLHNNYFIVDLSFEALFVVILGYLLVMTRFDRSPT